MELWHSIVLALVEGITEFLPISSTGHMILTSHLLGIGGPVVHAFEVFIQLGAILAIVVLYKERFACLLDLSPGPAGWNRKGFQQAMAPDRGFRGWRGLALLAMTSLPILIAGKLLESFIKGNLFNPASVAWSLALGGLALILVERRTFRHAADALDQISFKQALSVGLFQCLALWPGMSRSASTIIGGMFSGFQRTVAAEYSFLAAVPIMAIVCTRDLIGVLPLLGPGDLLAYAVGFVVAFLSALIAVKSFVQILQKSTMAAFGYYRIALALLVFLLLSNQPLE